VKLPSCHSTSPITPCFRFVVRCSRAVAFRPLSLFSFFTQVNPRQTFSTYLKPRVNSPTVSLSFNWPRLWDSCLNSPGTFSSLSFLHRLLLPKHSRPNAATRKSSAGIVLRIRLASSAKVTSSTQCSVQFPSDCAPLERIPSRHS